MSAPAPESPVRFRPESGEDGIAPTSVGGCTLRSDNSGMRAMDSALARYKRPFSTTTILAVPNSPSRSGGNASVVWIPVSTA